MTAGYTPLFIQTKIYTFHIYTAHLDIIKVFFFIYPPNDAQVNCLKNSLKIYNKTDSKQFRNVSFQSPSSGSTLFELAEVTVVKIIN